MVESSVVFCPPFGFFSLRSASKIVLFAGASSGSLHACPKKESLLLFISIDQGDVRVMRYSFSFDIQFPSEYRMFKVFRSNVRWKLSISFSCCLVRPPNSALYKKMLSITARNILILVDVDSLFDVNVDRNLKKAAFASCFRRLMASAVPNRDPVNLQVFHLSLSLLSIV